MQRDAADGFLRGTDGQRRVGRDRVRERAHGAVDPVRIDQARHEAKRGGLVRVEQPAGEQQVLRARRPDEIDEPRVVGRPTGSCRASARSARRTARPACTRAGRRPARSRSRRRRRRPGPARWSRTVTALEPIDDRVEPPLVGEAVGAGRELRELTDVGARPQRRRRRRAGRTRGCPGRRRPGRRRRTSASYISHVSALRASGRLNVRNAIGPSTANNDSVTGRPQYEHGARRARRHSRAGRHAGDGRPVLRDATMRHGRRRDQGRAARRRLDAAHGGRVGHRQRRVQRRQPRQARHRARPEDAAGTGRVPPPRSRRTDIVIENYRPGRHEALRARLRDAGGRAPGADLRVDLGIRTDRTGSRRRAASIWSRRASRA